MHVSGATGPRGLAGVQGATGATGATGKALRRKKRQTTGCPGKHTVIRLCSVVITCEIKLFKNCLSLRPRPV